MNQSMTPQQALEIVVDATGKLQADRNTHSVIQTALKVLEGVVQEQTTQAETKE